MKTNEKCKYCDYEGFMDFFIKPFESEYLKNLNDNRLPKFGFHYGSECPMCGKWQKWKKQDGEITNKKFYERENQV